MFTLALALGRTVAEIEEGMTAAEFLEWQEYYSIEPFGELRGDARIGVLGAGVAMMLGAKNVKVENWMPHFKSKKPKSPEQLAVEADTWARAIAGLNKSIELGRQKGRK